MLAVIGRPGTAELDPYTHLVSAQHSLRSQSERAFVPPGDAQGHKDGWGLGWFDEAGRVSLIRELGPASESAYYVFAAEVSTRQHAGSGPANVLIGHLRKAVSGAIVSDNSHPFRVVTPAGVDLLICHNGCVRDSVLDTLRADLVDAGLDAPAKRDCDSAVLAEWLALQVGAGRDADALSKTLGDALNVLLLRAQQTGNAYEAYTGLNLMIASPFGLGVLRWFSRWADYYTLWEHRTDDGVLLCSEPTYLSDRFRLIQPGNFRWYAPSGELLSSVLLSNASLPEGPDA